MVLYSMRLLKCFLTLQDFISAKRRTEQTTSHYGMNIHSDMYGYFSICSSIFKLRDHTMSNANTEYNVLAVFPWKVSWFMFLSLFLRNLFCLKKHWEASVYSWQKCIHVTYYASLAAFNWERSKPGTARGTWVLLHLQHDAKTFRPSSTLSQLDLPASKSQTTIFTYTTSIKRKFAELTLYWLL